MACLAAAALAATLALLQQPAQAFYLPGVAPHEYKDGDPVRRPAYFRRDLLISRAPLALVGRRPLSCAVAAQISLKVNKLSSTKTSLPYEYYHLPFCKPDTVRCQPRPNKHLRASCRRQLPRPVQAPAQKGSLTVHPRATSGRWKTMPRTWAKFCVAIASNRLSTSCR